MQKNSFLYSTLDDIRSYKREVMSAKMKDGSLVFPSLNLMGDPSSNCAIIYGDNASGKSFVGQLVDNTAQKLGIASRKLGMGIRVHGYSLHRAAIFGNEQEQSTGVTSFKATLRCIKGTSLEPDDEAVMILDEPDIGLSPRYSKALGKFIASSFNDLPNNKHMVVVSHNETLIKAITSELNKPMLTLGVGTEQSLDEWITDPEDIDFESLVNLEKIAFSRHSAIDRKIDEIKKQRS